MISNFSKTPVFTPKSNWKPPKGQTSLEVFLSQIEKEVFELAESLLKKFDFSEEEWQAMVNVKDSEDFIKKLKNINHISQDATIVIADVAAYIFVSLMP